MNIKGIKEYWSDLENVEKTHGISLSLWKKRKKVKELSTHKSNIDGWNRNKRLKSEILKLGRFKNISFDSIKTEFNLTRNETASVLRYLVNKKYMEKIRLGVYQIK